MVGVKPIGLAVESVEALKMSQFNAKFILGWTEKGPHTDGTIQLFVMERISLNCDVLCLQVSTRGQEKLPFGLGHGSFTMIFDASGNCMNLPRDFLHPEQFILQAL